MPKPTLPLEARDQQIAALAAAGVRQGEIARRLGVHRNSVGRRLRLPTVQAHIEAMQAQVFERVWQRESERIVEQLEAGRQARQEERARRRAQRQGQGTALPREDSQPNPYWPTRQHAQAMAKGQALAQQRQDEAFPLEHEPAPALPSPGATMPREQGLDPAFYAAQEERWQTRLEELKRWPV